MSNWPAALPAVAYCVVVAAALMQTGVVRGAQPGGLGSQQVGERAEQAAWPHRFFQQNSDTLRSDRGPEESEGLEGEALAEILWKESEPSVPVRSLLEDEGMSGGYSTFGTPAAHAPSSNVYSNIVVGEQHPPGADETDYYYGYYYYDDSDSPSSRAGELDTAGGVLGNEGGAEMPSCPGIGFEYRHVVIMGADPAGSTIECEARCLSYPGACQAWAWVDPLRAINRSDLGICYLNYEANDLSVKFLDNGVWAGNPACGAMDSNAAGAIYLGWSCPGAGYQYVGGDYITLRSPTAWACQDLCRKEPHCESWTWYEDRDRICNLKNGFFSLVAANARQYAGTRSCHYEQSQP